MAVDTRSAILIRTEPDIKAQLLERARKNHRSLSAEITHVLERLLAQGKKAN